MKKIKQIAAIIMCVILVGMYVASFIAAIFAKPQAHGLFMGSVGLTIMLPLLLYAYTIIYRVLHPAISDEEEPDIYGDDEYAEDESGFDGDGNYADDDVAIEEDDNDF